MSTARYRAASRHSYAQALLVLLRYAREHGDDFEFGPLDLAALEHQGLAVTGPDLTGVRQVLSAVPGLEPEE
jgi:hypothetical protein